MTRYVAFLRAINIGKRQVKMERLRGIFEQAGLSNVSTFIASGNVIFEGAQPASRLEAAIETTLAAQLGFDVTTMLRRVEDVRAVLAHIEKKQLTPVEGVMLYVGFLKCAPTAAAVKAVTALSNDVDSLYVHRSELFWVCRKTFSQSTVTPAKLEKALGVPATVRSFTSIRKLLAKIEGRAA
jgi:uncharacterized protein (DUF1697 family)